MEICTKSWCAALLTLIFKVICSVIMGLEHWTRLCASSKGGNLEWDYCWKFFSKQKERECQRKSQEEETNSGFPILHPSRWWQFWQRTPLSTHWLRKKICCRYFRDEAQEFQSSRFGFPSPGLLARPFPHFLYLTIYQPHSFLSTGLASGGLLQYQKRKPFSCCIIVWSRDPQKPAPRGEGYLAINQQIQNYFSI